MSEPAPQTFATVFTPGANRFEILRLAFAGMVLFDHGFVLSSGQHALAGTPFRVSLGHLGVACFFIVSGALIAASYEHCRNTVDFLRNRALRIFPGYWACLLVSAFVIGPINALLVADSAAAALREYFAAQSGPLAYVWKNALLIQVQPGIGDLFPTHHERGSINGSLWSIPWEAGCYLFVAAFGGTLGLTRWRALIPVGLALVLLNNWIFPSGSVLGLYYLSGRVLLLPTYFLSGMAFYLFRERLPRTPTLGASALAALVGVSLVDFSLAAPFLAYVIFFAAGFRVDPTAQRRPALDLSYGVYIYGFPVQQTLVTLGLHQLGVAPVVVASALIVPWLALLSWRLVEAPALALKQRSIVTFGRPSASLQ